MKRTHLTSFSSRNNTQEVEEEEGDTSGDDSIIMNHYKNYEAGLIPWPPKNYTCSFCRREFRSAQALGGHMNVHRRDRAKLRQIPSWLFVSHHHTPVRNPSPNLSSFPTTPAHFEPSPSKNNNNVRGKDLKKSDMDSCHAAKYEMIRGDLMNKKDGVVGLELGMSLRNPKQVLDLELRLGCL